MYVYLHYYTATVKLQNNNKTKYAIILIIYQQPSTSL